MAEEVPVYKLAKVGSGAALGRKKKDKKSGLPLWLGGGGSSASTAADVAAEAGAGAGGAGGSGVVTGSEAVERLLSLGESYGGGVASAGGMGAIFGSKAAIVLLVATLGAAALGVGHIISPNLPLPGATGGGLFPKEVAYTGNVSNLPNDASVTNSQGFGGSPAPISGAAFTASPPSGGASNAGSSGGKGSATSAAVANGPSVIAIPSLPSGSTGGNSSDSNGYSGQGNNGAGGNGGQASAGGHSRALSAFAGGATAPQTGVPNLGLKGIGQDALGQLGNTARYSQDALSPGMAEKEAATAGAPFDNGAALPTTVADRGGTHLGGAGSGSSPNTGPGSMNPGMAPGGVMAGNGGIAANNASPSSQQKTKTPPPVHVNPLQHWINLAQILLAGAMVSMMLASLLKKFPSPWTQAASYIASAAAVAAAATATGIGVYLMTQGQMLTGGMIAAGGAIIAATAFLSGFGGRSLADLMFGRAASGAAEASGETATGTELATKEASTLSSETSSAAAGADGTAAAESGTAAGGGPTVNAAGVGGQGGLGMGNQMNVGGDVHINNYYGTPPAGNVPGSIINARALPPADPNSPFIPGI